MIDPGMLRLTVTPGVNETFCFFFSFLLYCFLGTFWFPQALVFGSLARNCPLLLLCQVWGHVVGGQGEEEKSNGFVLTLLKTQLYQMERKVSLPGVVYPTDSCCWPLLLLLLWYQWIAWGISHERIQEKWKKNNYLADFLYFLWDLAVSFPVPWARLLLKLTLYHNVHFWVFGCLEFRSRILKGKNVNSHRLSDD